MPAIVERPNRDQQDAEIAGDVTSFAALIKSDVEAPQKAPPSAATPPPAAQAPPAKVEPAPPPPNAAEAKPAPTQAKPGEKAPAEVETHIDYDKLEIPRSTKAWDAYKAKAKERQNHLEQQARDAQAKATEFEARVKEIEAKPPPAPTESLPADVERIAALEKEVETLHREFMVTDITADPTFKAHFEGPIAEAIQEAKLAVGTENAEAIERILKLQDSDYQKDQLSQFLTNIDDELTRDAVKDSLRTIKQTKKAQTKAIADAEKLKTDRETVRASKAQVLKKQLEDTFTNTMREMQDPKTGFAPLQKRDGDAAWNAGVDQRVQQIKALLKGENVTMKGLVDAAAHAICSPFVYSNFIKGKVGWDAEKAALISAHEKAIGELKAAVPGAGAGPSTEKPTENAEHVKAEDAAKWEARQLAAALRG
jgi:hypothetical protein